MASKILVIGALHGRLHEVLPKITALHKKQNFTLALVIGDFFPPIEPPPTQEQVETTEKVLRGELKIPLPMYFGLGRSPLPESVVKRLSSESGGEVCENLFFLGRKGVLVTSEGIRMVVLGGREDVGGVISSGESMPNYSSGPASGAGAEGDYHPFYTSLEARVLRGANSADILITYEWPSDITNKTKIDDALVEVLNNAGKKLLTGGIPPQSTAVRNLVRSLRPRYHFATGAESIFWEREPYLNDLTENEKKLVGEGREVNRPHVTRFIALADWGNKLKKQDLYAFNINVQDKNPEIPLNAGENPYDSVWGDAQRRGKKRPGSPSGSGEASQVEGSGTFFWGDPTTGHGGGGGRGKRRRDNQPHRELPGPESCFFCLSNPQLEKHLIVSIGNEAYLTTAKGPLTSAETNPPTLPFPAHILIIPLAHSPTLELIEDPQSREDTFNEMTRYRYALESMLSERGCGAVTFEVARRKGGVHTHWQLIPIKTELLDKVEDAFHKEVKYDEHLSLSGAKFERREVRDDEERYFRVWISGKEGSLVMHLREGVYFDTQFGRRVVARLLGSQNFHWRDVEQSKEEEVRDARAFKEAFKTFDFTL